MELSKIRVRHGPNAKDIFIHKGLEVSDLYAMIKAAFPAAGVIGGITDETSKELYPLSAVVLNPAIFKEQYVLAIVSPPAELAFEKSGVTHRITIHERAEPADVSSLLHTLFDFPPSALIVGVSDSTSMYPISSLCDNPAAFAGRTLTLLSRGDNAKKSVRFSNVNDTQPAPTSREGTPEAQFAVPPTVKRSPLQQTSSTLPGTQMMLGRVGLSPPTVQHRTLSPQQPLASTSNSATEQQASAEYDSERAGQIPLNAALSGAKIDKARRKVKVYRLNDSGEWDDLGTGICVCGSSKSSGPAVLVMNEDNATLLRAPIAKDLPFVREQPTLIVWDEFAISFQDAMGCEEIWSQIQRLQGPK